MRSIGLGLGVVALLVTHLLLALTSVRRKSPTFDETAHLVRGVSLWKTGNYTGVAETPPLIHLWAAAPVVLSGFELPDLQKPDWWLTNRWTLGGAFLYERGNDPQAILIRGRAMIALLSVALGLVVWLWSRRLFGQAGGMISLILYALSPTMLAHARLITADLAAALFFLVAVTAVWWVLHHISPPALLLSALAIAGLALVKMSAPIILPIAGLLVLIRLLSNRPTRVVWRRSRLVHSRPKQLGLWSLAGLAQVLMVVFLMWGAYSFRYTPARTGDPGLDPRFTPGRLNPKAWDAYLGRLGKMGTVIGWLRDKELLPETHLYGLAYTYTLHGAQARPAFLNGRNSYHGWLYFFPYCFAVKTPLPLFGILLMAALAVGVTGRGSGGDDPSATRSPPSMVDGLYRTAPLWVLFVVYWCFAIGSNLNIGHRHVLPVYPVLFILAGGASAWLGPARLAKRLIVPGLVGLFVVSSLMTWPHYLTYFNTLVGGPENGYKHLVDSSLDWGQDLPELKRWLDEHVPRDTESGAEPARPTVYLSYFGVGPPKSYGIAARMLPSMGAVRGDRPFPLTGGVYCISATLLHQLYLLPECRWTPALEACYQDLRRRQTEPARGHGPEPQTRPGRTGLTENEARLLHKLRFARLCAYLRQRRPDDNVAHTILIYRLGDEDINRALSGDPPESVPDQVEKLLRFLEPCLAKKCYPSAVTLYEHIFKLLPMSADPAIVTVAANYGIILGILRRESQAIAVLREGLRHDPDHLQMNNVLARLLATSPSSELRNGEEALRRAKTALEVSKGRDPTTLDSLAAAHAELGQFEQACHFAAKALRVAREKGPAPLAREIAAHLESYRSRRPWRER